LSDVHTLSLHDALPILYTSDVTPAAPRAPKDGIARRLRQNFAVRATTADQIEIGGKPLPAKNASTTKWMPKATIPGSRITKRVRSEEHTSELQSLAYLV